MTDLDKALELAQKIIEFCEECDPKNAMDDSFDCRDCPDVRPREYYLSEQLLAIHDQTRWIPVKEALPEICGHRLVLCATGLGKVFVGELRNGNWTNWQDNSIYIDVTHWMPLPLLPEPTDND